MGAPWARRARRGAPEGPQGRPRRLRHTFRRHGLYAGGKCPSVAGTRLPKPSRAAMLVNVAATGTRLALAAPHADASRAGREAFADGGNAVDAALAACATLTVVYPHMCSIGGDLIALLHAPDGRVTAINASGAAPAALTRDVVAADLDRMRRRVDAGRDAGRRDGDESAGFEAGPRGMPIRGPHTVTVPGVLSGWAKLHELGGALDWGRILRPAVERATTGMTVSPGLAAMFAGASRLVLSDPGLRAVFARGGSMPAKGDLVRQPALAASLKILAHDGVDAFYRGPLGAAFVAGLRAAGSLLTVEDLAAHQVEVAAPLVLEVFGHEVLTAPPNSQGFVLLELLGALELMARAGSGGRAAAPIDSDGRAAAPAGSDTGGAACVPLDPLGPEAGALARLFRRASADRERYLCDPRFREVPLDDLLGKPHLEALARRADDDGAGFERAVGDDGAEFERAAGDDGAGSGTAAADGDTIACVAADSDGWAVSIIQSLYFGFGSGILEPATGIIAQDRGACFSLDPSSPNVIEGGKRPLHTLMPVLVKRDDRLTIVAGTRGGEAQPQIHAQILSRMLRTGTRERAAAGGAASMAVGQTPSAAGADATAQDAVAAPRWIYDEGAAYAEVDVPDACRRALQASGLPVEELGSLDDGVGHAQYIHIDDAGRLDAGSDPRADGEAVVWERP